MTQAYQTYIQRCSNAIRAARPHIDDETMRLSAPFILRPSQPNGKGMVLVHGLLDSCFILRDIANIYVSQGYVVYGVLLPGHGTMPSDLLTVTAEEWLNTVSFAVDQCAQEVENISIGGFSTGASLALLLAAETPKRFSEVVVFAPAIAIRSRWIWLTGLIASCGKWFRACRFVETLEEDDQFKYRTLAYNGAYQVYRLSRKLQKVVVHCPIKLIMSAQDETVSYSAALAFFNQQIHPDNKALIFNKTASDNSSNIQFVDSCNLTHDVIECSHHGIMVSPNNPYYGQNGKYQLLDRKRYKGELLGAVFKYKVIDGKRVSRAFYNSQFTSIKPFIA